MRHPDEAMADSKAQLATRGANRAQITLQELQDLAERQRQQILYNSKELMEKQQQLMRMHQDFRSKIKVATSQPSSPISPAKEKSPREQDAYAKMLRDTYQSHIGKLHGRSQVQTEVDVQKFSNVELAQELDKVRAIFSSKQSELADAVRMVDVLTKQLDERKDGVSNLNHLPTPQRINRRRKLQAAQEELDRLRNELVVRNETNTQQNHQLQLQRDIVLEKKHELRELNNRMHRIGSVLRQQYSSNVGPDLAPLGHAVANGFDSGLFNDNYLQDTLTRKRNNSFVGEAPLNGSIVDSPSTLLGSKMLPYTLRGELYVASDDRELGRPSTKHNQVDGNSNDLSFTNGSDASTSRNQSAGVGSLQLQSCTDVMVEDPSREAPGFQEAPPSGNQIWINPNANMSTPSIRPSLSGSREDSLRPAFLFGMDPPPPPPRTTPIGVLIDRNQLPPDPPNAEYLAGLRKQKSNRVRLEVPAESPFLQSDRTCGPNYADFGPTLPADKPTTEVAGFTHAAGRVAVNDVKTKEPPALKPKPALPAKPTASVAPLAAPTDLSVNLGVTGSVPRIDSSVTHSRRLSLVDDDPNVLPSEEVHSHLNLILSNNRTPKDLEENLAKDFQDRSLDHKLESEYVEDDSYLPPSLTAGAPRELEEFQLSFADIDEINLTQTELVPWNVTDSESMSSQDDSDSEASLDMSVDLNIVPVVISVPPDKMPPPILKRPDTPRGHNRRIVLDPFTLLLDAALEGEMETVKLSLAKVADPSRPNAEGITPLHNAVCGNHKEVVKFLVEVGCDINAADNNGWTPLHCAAFYNDTELCRLLVEHGASVFATTCTDYQTPAHKCSRLDDNYDQCFAYLHECKENVGRANNSLVYALFDYKSEEDDELSFLTGEALTIVRRGDAIEKEWWWAKSRRGDMGYVPCNFIGNFARIDAEV